jgi:hypothetical protein
MSTPEHTRAAAWAERCQLDTSTLATATGYAAVTIYWFLRGEVPVERNAKSGGTSRRIKPWVWQRFKRACGDVDAEIHGRTAGQQFDW